jgi:hypothetical protein
MHESPIVLSTTKSIFVNIGVKNMTGITQTQKPFSTGLFVILGAIFWFEALLFIRFEGTSLFVNGNPFLLLLFVASVPIAWSLVKISEIVTKVQGDDILNAVEIVVITATSLDGIALTWFPSWYDLAPAGLLLAAAWLL